MAKIDGYGPLSKALTNLENINMDAVIMDNIRGIYNRGKAPGGTPVRTGELRASLTQGKNTAGYTKEYAAPVEYGHRTRNGGYVPGRYYLKANVEAQRPILRRMGLDLVQKAGDRS